nr:hypothetical protein [Nanoarchaeum sp.]
MSLEIMLGFKNKQENVNGIAIGFDNVITHCKGLEIGIMCMPDNNEDLNLSGVGLNFFGGYKNLRGIAAGLITGTLGEGEGILISGLNVVNDKFKGFNLGAVNLSFGKFYGVQIGAVCYAKEGNYLQIGLLNIRKDGDKLDFSPGIGYHHSPQSED